MRNGLLHFIVLLVAMVVLGLGLLVEALWWMLILAGILALFPMFSDWRARLGQPAAATSPHPET
jgi:hypothetical protein